MNQYAKALVAGITTGGAAFLGAYGARPLPEVVVLTIVAAAGGAGVVWGVPNAPATPKE